MDKLLLIDADGLVYHSSRETLEESIQVLNDKIQNMYDETGATHANFFISQGKYFRHSIFPDYKKSRGNTRSELKWIRTLKNYLIEGYNALSMNMVEADDLVAYWNKNYSKDVKTIICSPDKDLLHSIEGTHFNYSYKLMDKENPESVIKGWWVTTTEEEANTFKNIQLLMGDSTDGITGIPGVGIKGAEKFIQETSVNSEFLPERILSKYISYYHSVSQGIYEFQKNYRLLHLLTTNEDFMQEIGELPLELVANIIKKEETEYYN